MRYKLLWSPRVGDKVEIHNGPVERGTITRVISGNSFLVKPRYQRYERHCYYNELEPLGLVRALPVSYTWYEKVRNRKQRKVK